MPCSDRCIARGLTSLEPPTAHNRGTTESHTLEFLSLRLLFYYTFGEGSRGNGARSEGGRGEGEGCSAGRGEGDARCLRAGRDAMVFVCGRSAGFPSCAGRRTTRVARSSSWAGCRKDGPEGARARLEHPRAGTVGSCQNKLQTQKKTAEKQRKKNQRKQNPRLGLLRRFCVKYKAFSPTLRN